MPFNIRERRTLLGLTLEEIGNFVGVSKGTVKKWESGYIKNMRRDKIIKLAEVLKVSPMDILSSEDCKPCRPYKTVPLSADIKEKYQEFILSVFDTQNTCSTILICKEKDLILISSDNKNIEQFLK